MYDFKSGKQVIRRYSRHETIEVRESDSLRWMHFDSPGVHTAIDLDNPHHLVLDYLHPLLGGLQFCENPKQVLLLGLGGGAIVHHLQYYFPETKVTVVELSSTVIELAEKYFMIDKHHRKLNLIKDEACAYLRKTKQTYDAIIVDVAGVETMPDQCNSDEFFQLCYRVLNPEGVLMVNILTRTDRLLFQAQQRLRKAFDANTITIQIKGFSNMLVTAIKCDHFDSILKRNDSRMPIVSPQYDPELGLIASSYRKLPWVKKKKKEEREQAQVYEYNEDDENDER